MVPLTKGSPLSVAITLLLLSLTIGVTLLVYLPLFSTPVTSGSVLSIVKVTVFSFLAASITVTT